jgi:hypothetical protein
VLQQQLEQVGESIYELEQVPKKSGWARANGPQYH